LRCVAVAHWLRLRSSSGSTTAAHTTFTHVPRTTAGYVLVHGSLATTAFCGFGPGTRALFTRTHARGTHLLRYHTARPFTTRTPIYTRVCPHCTVYGTYTSTTLSTVRAVLRCYVLRLRLVLATRLYYTRILAHVVTHCGLLCYRFYIPTAVACVCRSAFTAALFPTISLGSFTTYTTPRYMEGCVWTRLPPLRLRFPRLPTAAVRVLPVTATRLPVPTDCLPAAFAVCFGSTTPMPVLPRLRLRFTFRLPRCVVRTFLPAHVYHTVHFCTTHHHFGPRCRICIFTVPGSPAHYLSVRSTAGSVYLQL